MILLLNHKLDTNVAKEDIGDISVEQVQINIDNSLNEFKHILSVKVQDNDPEYFTLTCEPFKATLAEADMKPLLEQLWLLFDNLSTVYADNLDQIDDIIFYLRQE